MVRRWSHLNALTNISFEPNFALKKRSKLRLFKSNVKFKYFRKLKIKYTKTNRTQFKRLKHATNFLTLSHSFRTWTTDYQVAKNIVKFEYLFNILPRRTYVYNYNFIKNNSEAIFYNTAFLLSPNNSSILLPFSKFASLRKNFFFFNGNGIATAWSFDSIEADSPLFVPLVETYDDDFFLPLTKDSSDSIDALVVEEKFNFDDLFVFITLAAFRHLLNFYQLISFLIFFKA